MIFPWKSVLFRSHLLSKTAYICLFWKQMYLNMINILCQPVASASYQHSVATGWSYSWIFERKLKDPTVNYSADQQNWPIFHGLAFAIITFLLFTSNLRITKVFFFIHLSLLNPCVLPILNYFCSLKLSPSFGVYNIQRLQQSSSHYCHFLFFMMNSALSSHT